MLVQQERHTSPLRAVTQSAGPSPVNRFTKPNTAKAGLISKRPRHPVENDEYAAFVRRILRASSRHVGDGDVGAWPSYSTWPQEIDTASAEAVKGLRVCGYSWRRPPPGSASPARRLSSDRARLKPMLGVSASESFSQVPHRQLPSTPR